MTPISRRRSSATLLALALAALSPAFATDDSGSSAAPEVAEAPLAAHRLESLDLAFAVASLIPTDPHITEQTRRQHEAVLVALELDALDRARRYADVINEWRRGLSYADIAWHLAKRSEPGVAESKDRLREIEEYLALARAIGFRSNDWQRQEIFSRILQVRAALGVDPSAAERDLVDPEADAPRLRSGPDGESERIDRGTDAFFDRQVEALAILIESRNFELARHALAAFAELHEDHYANADRRGRIVAAVRNGWSSLPYRIRIEVSEQLARSAMRRGDAAAATEHLEIAESFLSGSGWHVEDRIALTGRLALLRAASGDREGARARIEAALALFAEHERSIIDIHRGGALRPVAEALVAVGDLEAAQTAYRLAVDQGAVNPNARPRAEDLSAAYASMARVGFEPSEELRARMREIREGLTAPW